LAWRALIMSMSPSGPPPRSVSSYWAATTHSPGEARRAQGCYALGCGHCRLWSPATQGTCTAALSTSAVKWEEKASSSSRELICAGACLAWASALRATRCHSFHVCWPAGGLHITGCLGVAPSVSSSLSSSSLGVGGTLIVRGAGLSPAPGSARPCYAAWLSHTASGGCLHWAHRCSGRPLAGQWLCLHLALITLGAGRNGIRASPSIAGAAGLRRVVTMRSAHDGLEPGHGRHVDLLLRLADRIYVFVPAGFARAAQDLLAAWHELPRRPRYCQTTEGLGEELPQGATPCDVASGAYSLTAVEPGRGHQQM
jgi:hypothetical protein